MARAKRDTTLEHRTNRLQLEPRTAPYWTALAEGEHVGYYRPRSKAAGTWQAKWRDKAIGERKSKAMGTADDYEDADGNRIMSWSQAQAKAREWFTEQAQNSLRKADGEEIHDGPYTVAAAINDYTRDCERRGVKAIQRQNCQVNAHILPTLGEVDVAKLTRGRIEKWLEAMATSARRVRTKKLQPDDNVPKKPHRSEKELKEPKLPPAPPATDDEKRARKDSANRVLTILKAALNHARDRGKVRGESPWQDVKPYRNTTSARVRFLSIEDQVRFVRACPPDFQKLVKAALHTGARFGELTHLTVAGYNREAQTLFVPAHISKSGKARHIFLTAEAQRFFDTLTAGREASTLLFQRGEAVKRRSREAGDYWAHGDQGRAMTSTCKAAKIDILTFHELRHTAASTWIAAGMDLILVARQLGHSDTRMVEKHYGHLCPNAAAARFRALAPELGIEGPEDIKPLKLQA